MDPKIRLIASPLHFITISNLLVFLACFIKPSPSLLPQRFWYVQSEHLLTVIFLIVGSYLGLFLAQATKMQNETVDSVLEDDILIAKVLWNGKVLYSLSILGYLFWVILDIRGWLGKGVSPHLQTIPGLTTLTQLMPLSLACLTYSYRLSVKKRNELKLIVIGIGISVYRSQINRERLSLLEVFVSIGLVILLTRKKRLRISLWKFYALSLVAIYLFFAGSEYFRSWEFYKNRVNQNFFQFAFDRMLVYYSTAINNGVVYLDHHTDITSIPLYTFNWIWNFPIFGNFFSSLFIDNSSYLSFKELLYSSMNTDEFNNLSPYLQVPAEITTGGAFVLFALILFMISHLYTEINSNRSWQIPLYSVLVLGLLEMPRIFWFGNGRAFPMLFMVVVMYRQLTNLSRKL